jgi:hypothetical protein
LILNANPQAQYYPCGLIANSYFTDIISNLTCVSGCTSPTFDFSEYGIAFQKDSSAFQTSDWVTAPNSNDIPTYVIPPPAWRKAYPELYGQGYTAQNMPPLGKMERFQIWMSSAGLKSFRKLWGKNTSNSLEKGTWKITIKYCNYF